MTVQMTAAGAQARSIMRWAWQDPANRAEEALARVTDLASSASGPDALNEITDAATMLHRLISAASGGASKQLGVGSQLARPMTLGEQIELASIHGHHIKGTAYTYRHGWIPVVGKHFNDKYPGWAVKQEEGKNPFKPAPPHKSLIAREDEAVPSAQHRVLTPEQRAMVAANKSQQARTQRAVARAMSPATPPAAGHVSAIQPRSQAVAAQSLTSYNTPSAAASPAADPNLSALAAPNANMAVLKSYIDARVAAEVAKARAEITAEQEKVLQDKLKSLHRHQQMLVKIVRKQTDELHTDEDKMNVRKTIMNQMFAMGGLGVALGGISIGLNPIQAAIAAGMVPIINLATAYVKKLA